MKGRINSWTGGMADDVRIQDLSSFFLAVGFDIFSSLKKITAIRSTEDSSSFNTGVKGSFLIARFLYVSSKLYGLGRVGSSDSHVQLFDKGSVSISAVWSPSANGTGTNGTVDYGCFAPYKSLIYGFAGGKRYIWAFSPAGAVFVDTALDTGQTNSFVAQGLATSDDLLLMPYDNKIAVKDGSATATANWETARLTLPSQYTIVDLEEYGSLVAITCKSTNPNEATGKVFLWDKVSADVTESIDVGEGVPLLSANIDGELITVIITPDSTFSLASSVVLRKYIGGKNSEVILTIPSETFISTANLYGPTKFKDGNRCSFICPQLRLDGVDRLNLMTIGRRKAGYPIIATLAQNPNNDTQPNSVEGAYKIGSYTFFAINADGTIMRTNTSSAYTATTNYISQKINGEPQHVSRSSRAQQTGQSRFDKVLKWAGITCPPLPAGCTITLYYRTDASSSWTAIFKVTTVSTQVFQAGQADTDLDGSPDTEFLNFKELQFKLTTTGGTALPAELISIDYEYELLTAPTEE